MAGRLVELGVQGVVIPAPTRLAQGSQYATRGDASSWRSGWRAAMQSR